MRRFVKIFSGNFWEMESAINQMARARNLNIVSASTLVNAGRWCVTVVFEKQTDD